MVNRGIDKIALGITGGITPCICIDYCCALTTDHVIWMLVKDDTP